jgi:hypothetical protein
VCDSCALRLRAFEEAGVEDPIPYLQRPRYSRKQETRGKKKSCEPVESRDANR